MEEIQIPCFATVEVKPNEAVKVEVPEGTIWEITQVSIAPQDNLPAEGRVVVYAATSHEDKEQKVAIAPLRLGQCEVVTVNFVINSASPLEFTTTGAAVAVSVSGNLSSSAQLKVTASPKK